MTHRIAVLVSGTGRHLENLARLSRDERETFDAEVALVVSNKPGVKALERAARFDLPTEVLETQAGESEEEYGARVFDRVRASGADTVVLAGFLKKLWIPEDYDGRVLNIHPSLLPAFGGKGYYGSRVHRAVLEQGVAVTDDASAIEYAGDLPMLVQGRYDNIKITLPEDLLLAQQILITRQQR